MTVVQGQGFQCFGTSWPAALPVLLIGPISRGMLLLTVTCMHACTTLHAVGYSNEDMHDRHVFGQLGVGGMMQSAVLSDNWSLPFRCHHTALLSKPHLALLLLRVCRVLTRGKGGRGVGWVVV
jgi:hypothetical protein